MTDKELLRTIRSGTDEVNMILEIKEQLAEEMLKPVEERNIDLIDELTKRIAILDGTDERIVQRSQRGIRLMQAEIHKQNQSVRRKRRWILTPCVCVLLVLLCNMWTISAFGKNAFSTVYQFLNGGVTINFSKQPDVSDFAENPYPSDMKKLCAEHEINAHIPGYIPDGFTPTSIYGQYRETSTEKILYFYFTRNGAKLNIVIDKVLDQSLIHGVSLPSDHYNISPQEINGVMVHILKEDSQYSAAFIIDDIQYLLAADGLDYDECRQVLESMLSP